MIWTIWKRAVCAIFCIPFFFSIFGPIYSEKSQQTSDVSKNSPWYISTSALFLPLNYLKAFYHNEWNANQIPGYKVWLLWAVFGSISSAWIFKTARQRYVPTYPVYIWALSGFVAPIIVIPFYVQFRPRGELWPCPSCKKNYLASLTPCPFCCKPEREKLNQPILRSAPIP